ncbi:TrlF family AAA-like ATPase [Clostridium sp. JNZ X4-2]|jgi:hypothetical protein
MNNFQRGSEWRRWDLHIHTPGTVKNDRYEGNSLSEKWDKFYEDVTAYIGDRCNPSKNIEVIGITDYLSIDNYKKVIADKRLPNSIFMIVPNVEMRVQPIASESPINIHFIFNPVIIDSIEDRFFSKISFKYGLTDFSAAHSELIRLGKTIDSSLNTDRAYHKGIEQYVPSFDKIQELFSSDLDLRSNTVILVSNSTNDGVSGATNHSGYFEADSCNSQLKAFRQSIYKFVDGIFSATPSDIAFFSGKKANCPEKVVIQQCGLLKPCLHGSDAHTNKKIFEPDDHKYCWIKADPTFNGLKQIIYEPVERVKISETMPDYKQSYYVIDHVEFKDDEFQTQPILFSDKLTCVIGGKSTGKSILLHNLAMSIDKNQVLEKEKISITSTRDVSNLTTVWADKKIDEERKIVYVPQTYLNRLSDDKEAATEIDKIIEEIVLLNADANKAHMDMLSSIKTYKAKLNKAILDLLETHKGLDFFNDQKKELGNRSGIESEISRLNEEKEKLSKELAISDEELKSYDDTAVQIELLSKQISNITSELVFLDDYQSVVEKKNLDYPFSDETKAAIDAAIISAINSADAVWSTAKRAIVKKLREYLSEVNSKLSKAKDIEESLRPKVQGNKAIADISDKLKTENENYTKFLALDKSIEKMKIKEKSIIETIVTSIDFFYKQHGSFANVVNTNTKLSSSELDFSVDAPFRCKAFIDKVSTLLNNRSVVFKQVISPDNFDASNYTKTKMTEIIEKILIGDLQPKGGNTQETILREIFGDWYNTKYNVKMDGDGIDVMSPGKKALVLLKLLIDLAESKCPILIDQPEDDLDNRSVFNDLIPFIKKKKKDRQIIVVTHNANVVLGADAEEVIVANQQGNNSKNKEKRFEYRSGSIENDLPIYKADGVTVDEGILNSQGIQQHICDILEGGEKAFELRKHKYHI